MKIIPAFTALLFILFFTSIVEAGNSITLNPDSGHSNQNQITDALKTGNVYLNAGIYEVDGPIFIGSNRVLSGDSNAIIKVWSGSSQWFTGSNSIISAIGPIDNLEIYGFQIDGSCDKLNFEFHHSRSDTAHDCERAIYVQGSTSRFNNNIKIHHMQISNCFSDGIHVRFANNVHCYSNFISNTQHEGIFWVCVQNGLAEGNRIAGITSDCMRFDNCVSNIIQKNYLFSYTGNQNNQAPKGWNKGIQVADSGASKGYDGSNKPTHTTDIVIRWNTFANCGTQSVWLDSTGKGYDNVHIYDNEFVGVAAVTNDGHDITLNISASNGSAVEYNNLTGTVQPSAETSEKVFTSILDFLQQDYIFKYPTVKHDFRASATVTDVNESVRQYSTVRVNGKDLKVIKFEYNGTTTRHFIERDMWTGELPHLGDNLYISGHYQPDKMKITVYGKEGYQNVENVQTKKVTSAGIGINPDFFIFIAVLAICGISIARNIRRII